VKAVTAPVAKVTALFRRRRESASDSETGFGVDHAIFSPVERFE